MKVIEFKATYGEGGSAVVSVRARTIESGFRKAARLVTKEIPRTWGNIHSLEFWRVV